MLSLRGLRNTHVSDAIHEEMRREGVSEEEFFKEVSKIKDNSASQVRLLMESCIAMI